MSTGDASSPRQHLCVLGLLLLALLPVVAQAQMPASADDHEARSRLLGQKLRLVELLTRSAVAQASKAGPGVETSDLLGEGQRLLLRAREAFAASRLDEAGSALDEALRNAARISARRSSHPDAANTAALQVGFGGLREQVATYRAALEDLAVQGRKEARQAGTRVDALESQAKGLAESGSWQEANRKLGEAYRLSIESLSSLRAGQTVTLSLTFDTPADEYAYERKRFQSSEMLVAMMIDEGRAEGERRRMVQGFVDEGKQLGGMAAEQADRGDYRSAIDAMERAATHLNRALQTMGVPVF